MALNKQEFRKDKPKPLRVRIVCGFTPLENIARNDSVQPVRSRGVSPASRREAGLIGQTPTISFLTG